MRRFVWPQSADSTVTTYVSDPEVTVPVRGTILAVVVGAVASSVRESGSKVKVRGVNDVLKPDKVVHPERSSWLSLRAHRKARGYEIPSLLCLPSVAGARVCGLLQGERELEQNAWFVFTCVVVHEHAFEPDGRVESYGC